ncbi:hypothetical protein BP6252_08014 [Coleophoma cylindrospora]|uniref:Zn(2)-C6 fungal-type domain-containing protein n=1 Tax=Coleophoma cylindrospora TaxID=1849047 RepID=A0A3D8RC45_9HELO|nr:hypothetical protein BP6252_08014 [Coleophoma cylindrospora]
MASETSTAKGSGRTPDASREPPLKRQRVARACRNCRLQKSKCDGRHPICGRCEGYGHTCAWTDDKPRRAHEVAREEPGVSSAAGDVEPSSTSLSKTIECYEKLLQNVRQRLPDTDRTFIDLTIPYIRSQLPEEIQRVLRTDSVESNTASPVSSIQAKDDGRSVEAQRYVGQASDIWFFHSVKEILQNGDASENVPHNVMQSYDGSIPLLERGIALELPPRELADFYIDTYFSTIHIAYPFISKLAFMERYENFWAKNSAPGSGENSWLSLFYTLLAIGAYYDSFPRSNNVETRTHLQYFAQALSFGDSMMTDCTLANVQALVAQCFFLLATGQTDRCWNTLGLAIRVGQSIGLYIEDKLKRPKSSASIEQQETMRRTWYSMYVLDRLIALQLGRPAAIHENDYCVNLPSKTGEPVSTEDSQKRVSTTTDASSLDYFLSVISFSSIIGQVINDLYSPSQVTEVDPDEMMLRTTALELLLSQWKINLPRHLRFDLGHTFEQSIVFRRQRNMLAIKFHHLRALIHRPYLCLAWLQRHNQPLMALLQRAHNRVEYFERTCVVEAQEIAHLLNNVTDERSLIYDFPWWQMISCLLCASSILLVASACIDPAEVTAEPRSQMLNEDAETCLKVFDALSVNSEAARRARDMMKDLKRTRILTDYQFNVRTEASSVTPDSFDHVPNRPMLGALSNEPHKQLTEDNVGVEPINWHGWPSELSDAMDWSAQFLDPALVINYNEDVSAVEVPQFLATENSGHNENST